MSRLKITLCLCGLMFFAFKTFGQQIIKPVLAPDKLQAINRTIKISTDKQRPAIVQVNALPNSGVVWIKELQFKSGIIEFDVKGKDVFQESFVGIAFHGLNDSSYEAVYFRPFNFQSTDAIRRKHAVQYIALPQYDWPYLRETFPDKYEANLPVPVDPNDWFHVKILVEENTIRVFINKEENPALIVQSLQPGSAGKIGFWTGNGSDGEFANLVITKEN